MIASQTFSLVVSKTGSIVIILIALRFLIIEKTAVKIEEFKKQRNIEIVSESVAHIDYNIDTKVKHGKFIAIPLK